MRAVLRRIAFIIPLDIDGSDKTRISYESKIGERIRNARLIVIDEITMLRKEALEYLERAVRDCMPADCRHLPFAGKTVVISGDWK